MDKHLIVIDGYGFVFRAYYSLPSLTDKEGNPIGAIYGFASMLIKLLAENHFSHIVVALDSGKKSFRHEIYPLYKANRIAPPEDLIPQFPLIREVIDAFSIKPLELEGYEADDIIATLAKRAKNTGFAVTIISSDKDLMQLISENISMYDPIKSKKIGKEEVFEKFGVYPEKVLDMLSLMGDSSDNIPGIAGVGPKTAAELLNKYHSLDDVLNNAKEITKPKLRESLLNNAQQAILSKKLVTLEDNLNLGHDINEYVFNGIDQDKIRNFLDKYNFISLKSRLKIENKSIIRELNNVEIRNSQEVDEIFEKITYEGQVSISLEKEYLLLVCNNNCFRINQSREGIFANEVSLAQVKNLLKKLLLEKGVKKIFYDYKAFLKSFDFECDTVDNAAWIEDIMLMAYILGNPNNLIDLIQEYFHEQSGSNIKYFSKLAELMLKKLMDEKLVNLYTKYDLPLVKVLYGMEQEGILISRAGILALSKNFSDEISQIENQIYKLSGQEFNIASPKQLGEVLYKSMGMSTEKKTEKSKSLSTGAEALEELAASGQEIASLILKWRHYSKLKNTYTDNLLTHTDKNDRIHTIYLATSTNTGRLSSIQPNLQNIPVRTEDGISIRRNFIAKDGFKLISADYSQIELRILAGMGDIKSLIRAFEQGIDIHTSTASEIFGLEPSQVTSDYRRMAKTINFGMIYGISPYGLASRLGVPTSVGKQYIERYFKRYPGIKHYMDTTIEFARKNGYVCTMHGRRCYIPGINDKKFTVRSFSERAAINAPLQGTQADIMKIAMIELNKFLHKEKLSAKILLQIHDELLLEAPKDIAEDISLQVKRIMEESAQINIKAPVDISIGNNWGEL